MRRWPLFRRVKNKKAGTQSDFSESSSTSMYIDTSEGQKVSQILGFLWEFSNSYFLKSDIAAETPFSYLIFSPSLGSCSTAVTISSVFRFPGRFFDKTTLLRQIRPYSESQPMSLQRRNVAAQLECARREKRLQTALDVVACRVLYYNMRRNDCGKKG
jgi:hypothetical protein